MNTDAAADVCLCSGFMIGWGKFLDSGRRTCDTCCLEESTGRELIFRSLVRRVRCGWILGWFSDCIELNFHNVFRFLFFFLLL